MQNFFIDFVRPKISSFSPSVIAKIVPALLLAWYFIDIAKNPSEWHFLNNADLIFHEAGHTLAFFMPRFLTILAGSAFQVIIPLFFVVYFFIKEQFYSASLLLFWVGESLINVSVYAKDAIVMELPLLGGGDTSGHDWHNMLSMTGLLKYTNTIGTMIWFAGAIFIAFAILSSLYTATLRREEKTSY